MQTSQIPKTFWHTVSVSLLAATVVLLYIALRSTSISIEIANAKINLNTAISETEQLNQELREQNEALLAAKEELQRKYEELMSSFGPRETISRTQLEQFNPNKLKVERYTIPEDRFIKNQAKLTELRKTLD
jgi:malate synthase